MSEIANYAAAVLGSISFVLWLLAASLQVYFNDPKSEYSDPRATKAILLCCQVGIPAAVLAILGQVLP